MGIGRGSMFIETPGWRRRKLSPDKKGYLRVTVPLTTGGTRRMKVHHMVLFAFKGPKSKGMEARHLDNCKTNNAEDNLAWGTPEENREDRRRAKRQRFIET
jgi:hypothetical protein